MILRTMMLAAAALLLADAPASTDPTIHMRDSQFTVPKATVSVGQTITFVNDDQFPHNVTGKDLKSGDIDGGQKWQFTFKKAGTYTYVCTYHPWMKGTITVKDPAGSGESHPDSRASISR